MIELRRHLWNAYHVSFPSCISQKLVQGGWALTVRLLLGALKILALPGSPKPQTLLI